MDVTVQAQGKTTFAELVERFAAGDSVRGVPGTASRVHGVAVQNPPRALRPMNDLPSANYDLIDVPRYFALKRDRQLDYISSTGCHFRFASCADPSVYGRRWVGLAPDRVGAEVESLWHRYAFTDLV